MSIPTLETNDKRMRLVVEVTARFDWREPPKDEPERIMRENADIEARRAAHRIQYIAQAMVAEILSAYGAERGL